MDDTVAARKTVGAVTRWLCLRAINGLPWPESHQRMAVVMEHSSLLKRLLQGKEPLDQPPPVRWGYPWYELVDDGRAEAHDVRESYGSLAPVPMRGKGLLIDQTIWKIVQRRGKDVWLATYFIPDVQRIARASKRIGVDLERPWRPSRSRWLVSRQDAKWIIERQPEEQVEP